MPNRRLMFDRLDHALVGSARRQRHGALLLIDLDHFKFLNDTHGHEIGDRLLVEVAQRLEAASARAILRPGWAATSSWSSSKTSMARG
jgi:diguanylate cyclase (GGDEF)-like protein